MLLPSAWTARKPVVAAFGIILLSLIALGVFGVRATPVLLSAISLILLLAIVHVYLTLSRKMEAHLDLIRDAGIQSTRQVQAMFSLFSNVQPRRPLNPMRGMVISPDFAAALVSLVKEVRPKLIIELGSGTSTVLAAYVLEQLGAGRIVSFDHDKVFADATRVDIEAHGLSAYAEVRHAELKEIEMAGSTRKWYDISKFHDLEHADLLIVDGPPGWCHELARYPALPLLWGRLAPEAVVIADDADRPDESRVIKRWISEFPDFEYTHLYHEKGTAVFRRKPQPSPHSETAALHEERPAPALS